MAFFSKNIVRAHMFVPTRVEKHAQFAVFHRKMWGNFPLANPKTANTALCLELRRVGRQCLASEI